MISFMFVVALYLLPTIVAGGRRHGNAAAIFMLNLFLGWTFIGWVIALVWSFTDNTRPKMRRGDRIYVERQDDIASPVRSLPEQFEGESDSAFAARVRAMRGQPALPGRR